MTRPTPYREASGCQKRHLEASHISSAVTVNHCNHGAVRKVYALKERNAEVAKKVKVSKERAKKPSKAKVATIVALIGP